MFRIQIVICVLMFVACAEEPSKEIVLSGVSTEQLKLDSASIAYITGKFDPSQHQDFELIAATHADRTGMYIRKEAYSAFQKMYEAAKREGINLVIRSAARNFDYQKGIWERKWTGQTILSNGKNASTDYNNDSIRARRILEYSSMPGSSRHHWGTDIDLNSFENSWFESGEGLRVFNWLEANAASYGFCRPYTAKGGARPFGYNEEKWHWSYLPIAEDLTQKAAYLPDSVFSGYLGDNTSQQIDILDHYILGINSDCKNHN